MNHSTNKYQAPKLLYLVALFILLSSFAAINNICVLLFHVPPSPSSSMDTIIIEQEQELNTYLDVYSSGDETSSDVDVLDVLDVDEDVDVDVDEYERIDSSGDGDGDRYIKGENKEEKKNGATALSKTQLIQIENNITLQAARTGSGAIFSHFFLHIPKTAGNSIVSMVASLLNGGIFKDRKSWAYGLCCNEGTRTSFSKFKKKDGSGTPCNFWMSEIPYSIPNSNSIKPRHTYTVIRSPSAHVVSQYFHCKESKDNKKEYASLMPPSLDDWLDHHVQRMDQNKTTQAQSRLDERFKCFDAINLQSMFAGFNETMSESQLRDRFDVIGVMDELEKSACAVSIRYTGVVDPRCDCTDAKKRRKDRRKKRRRKKRNPTTTTSRIDHGVKHHGATFKLTDNQASKVQKLTRLDSLLYDRAKDAFAKQVKEIEKELDIVLCQNPFQ